MGRALVRDPDVFLFDEPLSNLDAKLRVDMRTEIKKLHQKLGRTIVYVTHDQIEAMTLSTRIAVMNKGYVQQLGTPKEIYDTPGQPVRGELHGLAVDEPAEGEGGGAERRGPCRGDGCRRDVATSAVRRATRLRAWIGREVILGIRPEAITDPEGADRKSGNIQSFANRVGVTEPAGSDTFVTSTIGGRGLHRADAGGRRCAAGSGVRLRDQHGQGGGLRSARPRCGSGPSAPVAALPEVDRLCPRLAGACRFHSRRPPRRPNLPLRRLFSQGCTTPRPASQSDCDGEPPTVSGPSWAHGKRIQVIW